MDRVHIEYRPHAIYPDSSDLYAPSENYPEYEMHRISNTNNDIYDMIRNAFHVMGYDKGHFGTPYWNPLGEFIDPGDCVLLKPNFVKNYKEKEQYTCTLTHPSVIRPIIDYCIKAGAGKIVVGDAPVQGARFNEICRDLSIDDLVTYYRKKGVCIEVIDFRYLISENDGPMILNRYVAKETDGEFITVSLGKKSFHYGSEFNGEYKINGYTNERINVFHKGQRHDYVVSKYALEADVIINIPKPKTHRFAGLTAAQKNFIGVCSDKESLPHYRYDERTHEGDETNGKNQLAKSMRMAYRNYIENGKKGNKLRCSFYYYILMVLEKMAKNKFYSFGAWHGNDTIWRTILDVNKIILYTDQGGVYSEDAPKRKIITIGDMVICGEKDGPLSPSPKRLGMIMISESLPVFDYLFCKIAGFDEKRIPTVFYSIRNKLLVNSQWYKTIISSNNGKYKKEVADFVADEEWGFEPHPFWKEALK